MDLYCQLVTESSDINWVIIQVELQYGFITVVFVISCVETAHCLYHIISSDVYRGETSRAMLPHGHGVEFQQETGDGDIL